MLDAPADPFNGPTLSPGSNEWWLRRLGHRLNARRIPFERYDDYYCGAQPLQFASAKFIEIFGDRFPAFSSNFMALVIDSHRERLHVQGFRVGDSQSGDQDVWRWWNDNHLDSGQQLVHQEALQAGISYVMVWPNAAGEPEATVESALQTVVETAPGRPWIRRAALRRYLGEDLRLHAELYLPDRVYKYRSQQRDNSFSVLNWYGMTEIAWERERIPNEDWGFVNPIGIVPIVPFINRPRLGGHSRAERRDGQSEIAMVMSNQDAINKLRADALVSSEFVAFPQRWAIGIDIPTDPVTHEPIEDFRSAVDHLWTVPPPDPDDPNPGNVSFGQFPAADLKPYYDGIGTEVQHVGAITRTPYHYLLPQSGQPPSGDSLQASETGLVAKVRDSMVHKGEGWDEVVRIQFLWRRDPRASESLEVIWKDPERRTEAEHVDALLKLKALGVADELLLEMVPLSPEQIRRNTRALARQALLAPQPPSILGPNGQALVTSTTPNGITNPVR